MAIFIKLASVVFHRQTQQQNEIYFPYIISYRIFIMVTAEPQLRSALQVKDAFVSSKSISCYKTVGLFLREYNMNSWSQVKKTQFSLHQHHLNKEWQNQPEMFDPNLGLVWRVEVWQFINILNFASNFHLNIIRSHTCL